MPEAYWLPNQPPPVPKTDAQRREMMREMMRKIEAKEKKPEPRDVSKENK